jgi:hypothetical protein
MKSSYFDAIAVVGAPCAFPPHDARQVSLVRFPEIPVRLDLTPSGHSATPIGCRNRACRSMPAGHRDFYTPADQGPIPLQERGVSRSRLCGSPMPPCGSAPTVIGERGMVAAGNRGQEHRSEANAGHFRGVVPGRSGTHAAPFTRARPS